MTHFRVVICVARGSVRACGESVSSERRGTRADVGMTAVEVIFVRRGVIVSLLAFGDAFSPFDTELEKTLVAAGGDQVRAPIVAAERSLSRAES